MTDALEQLYRNFEPFRTTIPKTTLADRVYLELKHAILEGGIAPEMRLVESTLTKALGTSRTPVREAILKLEREGLVSKLPQGGFIAAPITIENVIEIFGIRSVLEGYAANLAAMNRSAEEIRVLQEKMEEFQICLEKGEMEQLPRINTEFHSRFYTLSRSPKLIKILNDLMDQIYRFRKIILQVKSEAYASNKDHRKIVEAINNRDATSAERLIKEHILRGKEVVLKEIGIRSNTLY